MGDTGRYAGAEAGVWAPYRIAAVGTQGAMQEQEQQHGRPHGAAAGETQDALAVAAAWAPHGAAVAVWAPHKAGVWAS